MNEKTGRMKVLLDEIEKATEELKASRARLMDARKDESDKAMALTTLMSEWNALNNEFTR